LDGFGIVAARAPPLVPELFKALLGPLQQHSSVFSSRDFADLAFERSGQLLACRTDGGSLVRGTLRDPHHAEHAMVLLGFRLAAAGAGEAEDARQFVVGSIAAPLLPIADEQRFRPLCEGLHQAVAD